ncbi:MAG TPA: hypothetical protein VNO30_15830 [Kofleriaceae bacterium]|nr:hypothetical protein [Kofleriaceae bacterium]
MLSDSVIAKTASYRRKPLGALTSTGLLAGSLLGAACAMETPPERSQSSSNTELLAAPADEVDTMSRTAVQQSLVPIPGQVGYYDMSAGGGQSYQVPPITAAGGTAINISDPSAAALTSLQVLWVHNPDNSGFGAEYLARRPDIATAVQNGMVLVIHDRAVTNANTLLPAGAGFNILRDFNQDRDINIRDASTAVTVGLTNTSLDGGNSSNHGFAQEGTLPAGSSLILSSTSSDRIVTFCYGHGQGAVIYSTIPLDYYLQGAGPNPPLDNMRNIYAPNVVRYAMAGACAVRNRPPVARCQDVAVDAGPTCSAAASIDNGSSDPDGDAITCTQSPAGPYGLGSTTVTLTCTDPGGLSSSCTGAVTVQDTLPPEVVLNPPTVLWPPNHDYRAFSIESCIQSITDQCGGALPVDSAQITRVTSDEPDDAVGGGDGATTDDMVITGATTVNLRAERQGSCDGRVYQVHFTVQDGSGNSTQASCPVYVPHDSSDASAIDSGVASCVGSGC